MAYRSQSNRLLRPSLFVLLGAALVPPLVAGCQSNVQQDLVAREMRMQEDQIYAMEDYLNQYQQLICKYRSENAALRRQLDEGEEEALPAQRSSPPARNGTPPPTNGPANGTPPPGIKLPPNEEIELPDVPPLEETTSGDAELEFHSGEAALAAGQSTTDDAPATQAVAFEPVGEHQSIRDVWLHGEVVANDAGGGPRLIVEVEPRDAAGHRTECIGTLSLMLLTTRAEGGQQSLARWDFSPEEVQSAVDAATGEHALRFYLELPAETPAMDATEIWVRLLPQHGRKVLAHAAIDLREPNQFTSLPVAPAPRERFEERPTVASVDATVPIGSSPIPTGLHDAGWSIARPGQPANLPSDSNEGNGQWHASSEPMPTVVSTSVPTRSKPRMRRQVSPPAARSKTPPPVAENVRSPGWSPDRLAEEPADDPHTATAPGRPSWSATR